jgi:hypothetical protein
MMASEDNSEVSQPPSELEETSKEPTSIPSEDNLNVSPPSGKNKLDALLTQPTPDSLFFKPWFWLIVLVAFIALVFMIEYIYAFTIYH